MRKNVDDMIGQACFPLSHSYNAKRDRKRPMGSYYDVDAILTDAEKIPCTFNLDLPGLGFLDENPSDDVGVRCFKRYKLSFAQSIHCSAMRQHSSLTVLYCCSLDSIVILSCFSICRKLRLICSQIRANTIHPLPLWLATLLCVQRLGPAGNAIVTLSPPSAIAGDRQLNALKADPRVVDLRSWCRFYWGFGGRWVELWDDDEVVEVLGESFKVRAAEIADFAHNPRGAPGEFAQRMDETEWRRESDFFILLFSIIGRRFMTAMKYY